MKAKLNQTLQNLGKSKFLKLAAAGLFLSDLLNIYYLTTSYFPKTMPGLLAFSVRMQGADMQYLGPETLNEVSALMNQSLTSMLSIFMLFHSLIYFLVTREKAWAQKYASGYSFMGVILTLATLPAMFKLNDYGWSFIMFLTTFVYAYNWWGFRYFKRNPGSRNS